MTDELRPAEHVTPETPPPEPVDEVLEFDEPESPSRIIDPAFFYIVLAIVALLGLNNFAAEIRYTILWTATVLIAVLAIAVDKLSFEPITIRGIIVGLGMGILVALPLFGVGSVQLAKISRDMFVGMTDPALFHLLVFTMPLAESLYYRGALHSARGAIFTGVASGIWWNILFLPQLNVLQYPFVAGFLGLCFMLINFLYSYVRYRFGLYASWSCQIVMNLLLLFIPRFV